MDDVLSRNRAYGAVSATFHEIFDPCQTIGCRARSWGDELEAFAGLGLNILMPDIATTLGRDVSLPTLVRSEERRQMGIRWDCMCETYSLGPRMKLPPLTGPPVTTFVKSPICLSPQSMGQQSIP